MMRWESVIGRLGEDVGNDSGRRLLSCSAENNFKVLNTYQHKEIHIFTRKCPGRHLTSTIDCFLVKDKMNRNENDVNVIRGSEIGSYYHLVLMKVRLHRRVHARKVDKYSRLRSEWLTTKEGKICK